MSKRILIITGEASGDLHGAGLVRALKERISDAQFFGVGGSRMLETGVQIIYPIGELAIIGVSGVLFGLSKIKKLFDLLTKKLGEIKPDLVILIDYPGFNLRFAKIAKKAGIPVIYYISPQVWAWGKFRISEIKRNVDKMVVLFKFEQTLYQKYGIDAEFVGHPLIDAVKPSGTRDRLRKEFGVSGGKVIALLPGSRASEIKSLLPAMLESFKRISAAVKNIGLLVAKYNQLPSELYEGILKNFGAAYTLVDGRAYDCVEASDLVIAASGSATLETAILEKPMIITYKVSPLTGIFFLLFVRIPYIGLVNIVAGRRIVPELLQYRATARNISKEAVSLLTDGARYTRMKDELRNVKETLGPPGASQRAANSILKFLNLP